MPIAGKAVMLLTNRPIVQHICDQLQTDFFKRAKMVRVGPGKSADPATSAEGQEAELSLPATVTGGSAAIAARLEQAILEGTYAHGARLPAERDLAHHFEGKPVFRQRQCRITGAAGGRQDAEQCAAAR